MGFIPKTIYTLQLDELSAEKAVYRGRFLDGWGVQISREDYDHHCSPQTVEVVVTGKEEVDNDAQKNAMID